MYIGLTWYFFKTKIIWNKNILSRNRIFLNCLSTNYRIGRLFTTTTTTKILPPYYPFSFIIFHCGHHICIQSNVLIHYNFTIFRLLNDRMFYSIFIQPIFHKKLIESIQNNKKIEKSINIKRNKSYMNKRSKRIIISCNQHHFFWGIYKYFIILIFLVNHISNFKIQYYLWYLNWYPLSYIR